MCYMQSKSSIGEKHYQSAIAFCAFGCRISLAQIEAQITAMGTRITKMSESLRSAEERVQLRMADFMKVRDSVNGIKVHKVVHCYVTSAH